MIYVYYLPLSCLVIFQFWRTHPSPVLFPVRERMASSVCRDDIPEEHTDRQPEHYVIRVSCHDRSQRSSCDINLRPSPAPFFLFCFFVVYLCDAKILFLFFFFWSTVNMLTVFCNTRKTPNYYKETVLNLGIPDCLRVFYSTGVFRKTLKKTDKKKIHKLPDIIHFF